MKNFIKSGLVVASSVALLSGALPARSAEQQDVTVSVGSIGGGWFVLMTTLFETYQKEIDGLRYNTVPGGGVANPIAVSSGSTQFGLSYSTNLFAASEGKDPYDSKMENLRAIANLEITAYIHPFVKDDLGISSLREIAEKEIPIKIDTGPRGTGGELAASRVLEAHGASYDKIEEFGGAITHSPYREAIDRVRDGHIDAFMNDELLGQPLFAEFASDAKITLLPQDETAIQYLQETYGYTPAVIPAGTYEGQDSDLPTTLQSVVFFTNADLPEETVYQMTKLLFEKKDDLVAGHASYGNLDPQAGPDGVQIPLHPGAERFYREIGAIK